jgi:2-polyprenyl-3-methyl-5-hydroxy-6-metoxy-1,4-benzoquinol methylase
MRRRLSQERHRVDFFRRHKSSGKVLDVGSGRGYFLEACRLRGYDVVGFDVSDDAAASVRDSLGIAVKTGEMREDLFEPGSLDVVTMWHALEHTPDPRVPLDLAWKWLSPNGLLAVEVPNHEGTDARKLGAKWGDWDLPFHLYHFNPSALIRLLDQCGFSILRTKRYHSRVVKERIAKLPVFGMIARPVSRLFSGSGIAVLAVRKGG